MSERKGVLLRLDPAVHDALARWAGDELRSTNAQIEFLLRRALADAGRLPRQVAPMRPRGRPAGIPAETSQPADDGQAADGNQPAVDNQPADGNQPAGDNRSG